MNKRKDIVPNNLKEFRLKADLTQKQVCQKLGFTNEVSLSHWEQGVNIPNLINVFKLSDIYNAPPQELYKDLLVQIRGSMT